MRSRCARLLSAIVVCMLASATPALAVAPTDMPFFERFPATNPCTGLPEVVTVTGTAHVHANATTTVVTVDRAVTTTAGFSGHGTSTMVINSEVRKLSLHDVLTAPSGARLRAGFILVVDRDTGGVVVSHGAVECVHA